MMNSSSVRHITHYGMYGDYKPRIIDFVVLGLGLNMNNVGQTLIDTSVIIANQSGHSGKEIWG